MEEDKISSSSSYQGILYVVEAVGACRPHLHPHCSLHLLHLKVVTPPFKVVTLRHPRSFPRRVPTPLQLLSDPVGIMCVVAAAVPEDYLTPPAAPSPGAQSGSVGEPQPQPAGSEAPLLLPPSVLQLGMQGAIYHFPSMPDGNPARLFVTAGAVCVAPSYGPGLRQVGVPLRTVRWIATKVLGFQDEHVPRTGIVVVAEQLTPVDEEHAARVAHDKWRFYLKLWRF